MPASRSVEREASAGSRVLVTRPRKQAERWVQGLQKRGVDAVALPLIEIQPAPAPLSLVLAWSRIHKLRLVMFVSANAVEQFFAHKPAGLTWPADLRAASTGPGTSRSLLALGVAEQNIVEPAVDAEQFDSEALWQVLAPTDWRGASVLIVRGDGGREWLADKLREQGARVSAVVAYHRAAPVFDAAQRALLDAALAQPQSHLWLFSSSEAIANLVSVVGSQALQRSWAIATHPRIASRAQEEGFGNVIQAKASLEAVARCVHLTRRDPATERSVDTGA